MKPARAAWSSSTSSDPEQRDAGQGARVWPSGKTVVKEGDVRIAFPPIVIPDVAALLGQFDELKDRLEMEILHALPRIVRGWPAGADAGPQDHEDHGRQSPDNQVL